MCSFKKTFTRLLFLFLSIGISLNIAVGQKTDPAIDCKDESLNVYSDSLWQLMVNYLPKNVIQISDSLITVYEKEICPDLIRVKSHRAYAYERLYQYETALEIYNELIKTAEEYQFHEEVINIKISLARLYETISRPEICKQHLNDLDSLFKLYEFKNHESHYYVRLASYHRIYEDKDIAKEAARKAILLGEESGRIGSLAGGYMMLSALTSDAIERMGYMEKCAQYCYEEGDFVCFLLQKMGIASMHMNAGDFVKPVEILNAIESDIETLLVNEKNYYSVKSSQSRVKSRLYEGLGIKDSVIAELKNLNKYSRLFGDVANQEKINQVLYDNAIEEGKRNVATERRWSKLLSYGIVGLLGLLLLIMRYYILNTRKSRKIKEQSSTISDQFTELEGLYNYQTTLLSEVHHRIKNNLQLIISLLTLQKAKLGNDVEDGILDMLSYRISSISLIHEQLYNLKEFERVDVGLYVRDLIKNFKSLILERDVDIQYAVDDISLNLESIIPLGLIWSELISNSLKYNDHSKSLKINFEITQEGEFYTMKYNDNGIGYPSGQFIANDKGMGYTIISSLTRQLGSESETHNSNGAHFSMKFKQKKISPL